MKLNNKGMTLVELIISIAIVTVAVVYFSQTLTTINKVYKKSQTKTDEYVDKNYALRMLDALIDEKKSSDQIYAIKVFCDDSDTTFCNNNKFYSSEFQPSLFVNKKIDSNKYRHFPDLGNILNVDKCNSNLCYVSESKYNPMYNILSLEIDNIIYYKYIKIDLRSAHRGTNPITGMPNNWWTIDIIN